MKSKTKSVYYCDFCKKHGLSASSMAQHEKRCTGNLDRECHWDWDYRTNRSHPIEMSLKALVRRIKRKRTDLNQKDIDYLAEMVGDCPACMLTVLKATGIESHKWGGWYYHQQIEKFNEIQKERIREEEYQDMMSTMY